VLYALIPVKALDGAKSRLADVLDGVARRALVIAMYRDALAAAVACPALDGVAMVSGDEDALALAETAGAEPMREPGGLNEALTSASKTLAGRGVDRLLVLFADLPLVNADAIERVARSNADVALVSPDDGGTNALVLAPGVINFQFGPDSAAKHVAAAERAGLGVVQLDEPSLALDIDTPEDLEQARQGSGVAKHTLAVLAQIGESPVVERR